MTGPQGAGPTNISPSRYPGGPGFASETFVEMVLIDPNSSNNNSTRTFYAPYWDEEFDPPEMIIKSGGGGCPVPADESLGRIVTAQVPFTPLTEYQIVIGGCRGIPSPNGGQASGTNSRHGASSSHLWMTPFTTAELLIVAAGGGARASGQAAAGNAGPVGGSGGNGSTGQGGTQVAGGAAGGTATAGSFFQGGNSLSGGTSRTGGGGGWYGGGGANNGSAGGGSSRVNSPAVHVTDTFNTLNAVSGATASGHFRDPLASTVQRDVGAEVVFGFHEMLGTKFYNLVDGVPFNSSQAAGITNGHRRQLSLNDAYLLGQGGSGQIELANALAAVPIPAAGGAHSGWMCEIFWRVVSHATANDSVFQLYDGTTHRFSLRPVASGLMDVTMQSTAGTLKTNSNTYSAPFSSGLWHHDLLRLTSGDTWELYHNGVLEESWAHGGSLSAENLRILSNAGGVSNSRIAVACFAAHSVDRYAPDYVTSVIEAFDAV